MEQASHLQPPLQEASVGLERMTVLEADLRRVALDLEYMLPVVGRLDAVRQRVLIHVAFNMGVERLLARLRFLFSSVPGKLQPRR